MTRRGAQTVRILLGMIEAKDHATAEHCRNVARLSVQLGREVGLSPRRLRELEQGALLHEADKLRVPDPIFDKLRGGRPLSVAETRLLLDHAAIPGEIPLAHALSRTVRECQELHHENYDGSGAPGRLAGDRIPLAVRILQVADTYDALTLSLPNRPGLDRDQALAELRRRAGSILDPALVECFCGILASE